MELPKVVRSRLRPESQILALALTRSKIDPGGLTILKIAGLSTKITLSQRVYTTKSQEI